MIAFSLLVCLWAVQAAVVLTEILGFCHAPSVSTDSILPESMGRMAAKWDIWIYIFFIAVALITGKIIFQYYRKPVNYWLLIFEICMTFLMVSAVFKILVYFNSPQLAQWSLTALIAISAVSKVMLGMFEMLFSVFKS